MTKSLSRFSIREGGPGGGFRQAPPSGAGQRRGRRTSRDQDGKVVALTAGYAPPLPAPHSLSQSFPCERAREEANRNRGHPTPPKSSAARPAAPRLTLYGGGGTNQRATSPFRFEAPDARLTPRAASALIGCVRRRSGREGGEAGGKGGGESGRQGASPPGLRRRIGGARGPGWEAGLPRGRGGGGGGGGGGAAPSHQPASAERAARRWVRRAAAAGGEGRRAEAEVGPAGAAGEDGSAVGGRPGGGEAGGRAPEGRRGGGGGGGTRVPIPSSPRAAAGPAPPPLPSPPRAPGPPAGLRLGGGAAARVFSVPPPVGPFPSPLPAPPSLSEEEGTKVPDPPGLLTGRDPEPRSRLD
ncbi:hypothetical protein R6Z07F_018313 [Ovis aries]